MLNYIREIGKVYCTRSDSTGYQIEFKKEFDVMKNDVKNLKEDFIEFKIEVTKRLDVHMEAIAEIKEEITVIKADIADIKVDLKNKVDKEDISDLRIYVDNTTKVYPPVFA